MAIRKIPVRFDSPDFSFQIELDGSIFGFRFVLNERTGRYAMTISTADGTPLVAGIAVTTNWKIIDRFKYLGMPLGRMFTLDTTEKNQEPNEINFGDTVILCYDEAVV